MSQARSPYKTSIEQSCLYNGCIGPLHKLRSRPPFFTNSFFKGDFSFSFCMESGYKFDAVGYGGLGR